MSTSHVLASIDSALADWGTSADAMRWAPQPPLFRLTRAQQAIAGRVSAQTGADGYAAAFMVLDVAARSTGSPYWPEVHDAIAADRREAQDAFQGLVRSFSLPFDQLAEGMRVAAAAFGRSLANSFRQVTKAVSAGWAHDLDARRDPRAHIRCAVCHPCANPGPMLYVKPSARRPYRRRRPRR